MTFFGKHTIVRKVITSIKKEPARYEILQNNEKETSLLLAEKSQRKTDGVRTFTAAELADYTNRAAMFHYMAMRA